MWGQDGWRRHRLVSYRARYLRFRYILFFYAPIQARILFETFFGVEGVESSPRSCAKEFRHLGWAPLFYHKPSSQVGTYSRSAGRLQVFVQAYHNPSVCGSSGSTVITPAFITPPNTPCGCSDVLSHPPFITPPHLSHPQTHLVGVQTSYHTPWFITPPLGPLRVSFYHPEYARYHTPHRIPHPVIIFF